MRPRLRKLLSLGTTAALALAMVFAAATPASAAVAITGITPSDGPVAGGTSVTMTGSDFQAGATSVTIGGNLVPAAAITVNSATSLTFSTPAHAAGGVDVSVTTPAGTATEQSGFLYQNVPTLSSASPATGSPAGNTLVTLSGTGLFNTSVTIGGITVTADSTSNTSVTFRTPAHAAGNVAVSVTNAGGTSNTLPGGFTYANPAPAPVIWAITPPSGSVDGGTAVTLRGEGFTGATSVVFDTTLAPGWTVVSDTQITVTTPAHAAGLVNVRVEAPGGSATFRDGYTFARTATVSSVAPNTGPSSGGTNVSITGTGFAGVTDVSFGGVSVPFTVNSATSITTTAPELAAGPADVVVTTAGGTSAVTSSSTFTSVASPTISNVAPNAGPIAGGTTVTVGGTNLSGASVVIGGTPVTAVTSATTAVFTLPAHVAGAVDISVTTAGGTTTSVNAFTYVAPPTIASLSPTTGTRDGGTLVQISGTNLAGATVTVDGEAVAATGSTTLTIATPSHAGGTVPITVTTAGGSATADFTYQDAPSFTAAAPAGGSVGTPFSYQFEASGFPAPEFTVTDGELPDGLTLTEGGLLGGTPTTAESATFEITATNRVGEVSETVTVEIEPADSAPEFINSTPPTPVVGTAYSYTFTASGYPAPSFTVGTGSLPAGLTLSPAGVLAGTPTSTEPVTFTVVASNGVGAPSTTPAITIVADPQPEAPEITTEESALPEGTIGEEYEFAFTATGTPAPTFFVLELVATTPTVPPGLSLSPDGRLSGIPTTPGSYEFTVAVNNGITEGDAATFTLDIAAVPVADTDDGDGLAITGVDTTTPVLTALALLALGAVLLVRRRRVAAN